MLISEFAKNKDIDFKNKDEIKAFNQIASRILNFQAKDLITKWDYELSKKEVTNFSKYWHRFLQGMPLAYITNTSYFYNSDIYVDKRVLIPRLETELLVEEAINFSKIHFSKEIPILADICSGSGAIGVSFLTEIENAFVFASDISKKALKVAKKNYERFDKESYSINHGDFLKPLIKSQIKANIIIINPPYISRNDVNISESTIKFEPHLALFCEDEGMFFYNQFFKLWKQVVNLEKPFMIALEFGFNQKEKIETLAKKHLKDFKWEIKKDYFKNWRYLIIS
ncbi:peptide chain release factor N(5)-glutamine methyltransferase [Spiroplasma alleghenense]|uniref:peptide chain release factor N(5)-glutamine methyltransferase n=1 Tax=Spiroplasma alleghenense TaxID=216931 RepID=A0A345Z2T8_9MOLU|nr:peptide chain release factor N(5)-glutamine methyltransferase [Spiroplasma alleghenense]AXK50917.1 N5-glutamine S-adenosyl-L-methionine-dependent methyltransferase [Spiroplasma alleghenense]